MIPARSVLTVMPLTAFSDPTALRTGCHCSVLATAVVTAAGAGANFAAIAIPALICHAFQAPIAAIKRNISPNMVSIRLVMDCDARADFGVPSIRPPLRADEGVLVVRLAVLSLVESDSFITRLISELMDILRLKLSL